MVRAFVLLFFCTSLLYPQQKYPVDDFRSPVDIGIVLSGTFGELRSNHFHSGIDIKTQKREGLKIYAIGDGYVSRIKVSHWGFGKALYVKHPNGFTSVYAHLQKFSPKIEAYVKAIQYNKKSFEMQVYPESDELTLTKGEVIAFSGNTGGSAGPHLHFEIRDSKNSKPINPLFFGLHVDDHKKPVVQGVFAYPIADSSHVNRSNKKLQININRQEDGSFLADKVTAYGKIGFGVNSFDRQDLAYNKNGVYKVALQVNGNKKFEYDFESFSFNETRYINTLIDYSHYKSLKQRIQKLFRVPANTLSIYNETIDEGYLHIEENKSYNVSIHIKDFEDNETVIRIPIEGKKDSILQKEEVKVTDKFLLANRDNIYPLGKHEVYFPKNTFYNNFFIDLKNTNDTLTIHNDKVPAHKNFTVTFDVSNYTKAQRQKMFIGNLNSKKSVSYNTTKKNGERFTLRTKSLGTYFLATDDEPPTVKPVNFSEGKWLSKYKYLKLKIEDKVSGIKTYRGKIDGKWVLFEYEPKRKTLTFDFEDLPLQATKHLLELEVTDNVGNSTTFTTTFYRKELN